jgi:hypothetical protein
MLREYLYCILSCLAGTCGVGGEGGSGQGVRGVGHDSHWETAGTHVES